MSILKMLSITIGIICLLAIVSGSDYPTIEAVPGGDALISCDLCGPSNCYDPWPEGHAQIFQVEWLQRDSMNHVSYVRGEHTVGSGFQNRALLAIDGSLILIKIRKSDEGWFLCRGTNYMNSPNQISARWTFLKVTDSPEENTNDIDSSKTAINMDISSSNIHHSTEIENMKKHKQMMNLKDELRNIEITNKTKAALPSSSSEERSLQGDGNNKFENLIDITSDSAGDFSSSSTEITDIEKDSNLSIANFSNPTSMKISLSTDHTTTTTFVNSTSNSLISSTIETSVSSSTSKSSISEAIETLSTSTENDPSFSTTESEGISSDSSTNSMDYSSSPNSIDSSPSSSTQFSSPIVSTEKNIDSEERSSSDNIPVSEAISTAISPSGASSVETTESSTNKIRSTAFVSSKSTLITSTTSSGLSDVTLPGKSAYVTVKYAVIITFLTISTVSVAALIVYMIKSKRREILYDELRLIP